MNALAGKKTYLVAAVIFGYNILRALNVLPDATFGEIDLQINMLLIALGFGALRAGVSRTQNPPAQP